MAKIGVAVEERSDFFKDILDELGQHHEVALFKRNVVKTPFFRERINLFLFRRDLKSLMMWSDVMFFEWASQLLSVATHLPKTCGIVTRLHRYEMYQWVNQINWDALDKIIFVSEAKRSEFVTRFPEQKVKTLVIPSALSLDKFTLYNRKYGGNIGILGDLTPRKRVYDLIINFNDLLQISNNFHLHIAGGEHSAFGDYYFAMRNIVSRLGLDEKVTFYGAVEDTVNWYKDIDIFVSNSYSEGLQLAPIEAMATGCYCLSHSWAGAEELLPEENLYISGQQLKAKILAFAEASTSEKLEKRQRMRKIALANFDIENTKSSVRQVVESVAATSH
jgi:glycosyltransferase involved in cell wall biosynthesis